METSSALLTLCEGNHRSPVDSFHKGQWRRALMFLLSAPEQLSKQSRRRWFMTPSRSLWRHNSHTPTVQHLYTFYLPKRPYSLRSRMLQRKINEHIEDLTVNSTMMTSSNGNIFRVTGHLCGEFTGPRWIPHTKASDGELSCLLWSAPG